MQSLEEGGHSLLGEETSPASNKCGGEANTCEQKAWLRDWAREHSVKLTFHASESG